MEKKFLGYLQGNKNHMLTYKISDHLEVIEYLDSDLTESMFAYLSLFARGAVS